MSASPLLGRLAAKMSSLIRILLITDNRAFVCEACRQFALSACSWPWHPPLSHLCVALQGLLQSEWLMNVILGLIKLK